MSNRPLVLIAATVDSGGGAGITADCITVFDTGAFPLPLACALAPESLTRVGSVSSVSTEALKESLKMACHDWQQPVAAVKVGLIPRQDALEVLLHALETDLCSVPVVWDPVLTATAGPLESADLKANLSRILKHVTIFTPNLPEALTLAGWDESKLEKEGTEALGRVFTAMGAKAVIIKGGHRAERKLALDVFVSAELTFTMEHEKTAGDGAHGGGCALSSALASFIAQGYALQDAAVLAKAYVTEGIAKPAVKADNGRPPIGHHGPCTDLAFFPVVREPGFPEGHEQPFAPCVERMGLYPVLSDLNTMQSLLSLGVRTLQLRIKDKNDPNLLGKIKRAVFLGRQFNARIFIDDYVDLAIEAGAYGVHLGMEDLREADLQKICEAGLHLGVSTHGPYELLKALQLKPSYIALGHIFPTNSKKMPSKPQGVEKLAYQKAIVGSYPTTAIGGIKLHNVESVLKAQDCSVALITGITDAGPEEIWAVAEKWLKLCGAGDPEPGSSFCVGHDREQ